MPSEGIRDRLSVVIAGHVDHGKSTVIGRLLADAGTLPDGKLEQLRSLCERTGKPFEYSFLLDALKDERAQGITIDTARVFFTTGGREFLVLDAPGHVEFVRNLVTGASRADAALLVIDAQEGVRENSRRHGYLMSLLGVRQLAVVVNKMDLVDFAQPAFDAVQAEYTAFLAGIGITPLHVIPAAARDGDNLAGRSDRMPWYRGPTVLEAMQAFHPAAPLTDAPFRMPVQDVYKFTGQGDTRRIVAGTVESGRMTAGEDVVFYPSGKRARVKSLEAFAAEPGRSAAAGQAIGFTLEQQVYVARGEIAARAADPAPQVASRLRAGLFWLGRRPLSTDREYVLKLGTARVPVRVEAIHRALDAASLAVRSPAQSVERHEVAECTLALGRPLAVDPAGSGLNTSRFVLVDDYDIAGGGLVRETLPDPLMPQRNRVLLRNLKWETSTIAADARARRYRQRATLLLLTGPRDVDRKPLAKALEARLFADGQVVYYLGMANVLYGVDADLGREREDRAEHIRRLGEIANLVLDAGVVLVATAAELSRADLAVLEAATDPERIVTAWLGDARTTDLPVDLVLPTGTALEAGVATLRAALRERGAFAPAPDAAVIWLTGLPASGKSTVGDRVAEELRERGHRVERLDGDGLRQLFPGTGFTREERNEHIRRVGHLAETLERNGVFVVASFVSPYVESRDFVRSRCRTFIEVHVSTPLAACEARDPKGLYAKARRGELALMTGVDAPYEPPPAADVTVDTSSTSVADAARMILAEVDRSMSS